MEIGKRVWVFVDGDLPPKGTEEPIGHEALLITNTREEDAEIELEFLFPQQEPICGIHLVVPSKRVRCFRMEQGIGTQNYQVPEGQYSLVLKSTQPVIAVFTKLDRRERMFYYNVDGYAQ